MQKFTQLQSAIAPLDRGNIDTDQIIPKQFLKSISRIGFGQFLFDEWRYLDAGELGMDCSQRPKNKDFVLNKPAFSDAKILLTRDNFGCGSSREHAVWALMEYGFRAVIAPSFGDIFASNSVKNGLLLITLPSPTVQAMFAQLSTDTLSNQWTIDLPAQTITDSVGAKIAFDIAPDTKEQMMQGLDDIGLTLQHRDAIIAHEQQRRAQEPWIFEDFKF